MKIKLLLIFFLALAIPVACLSQEKKHNYKPKAGYVAKAETAKQIAVAVWSPIYGAKHIQEKKPFKARLQKGIWIVEGSLPEGWTGGVPVAEIAQSDGRILRVSHGK